MDRRILVIGSVILIVGLLLVFAFWPLTGMSGEKLSEKRNDDGYKGYEEGDEEKVYGTITDLSGTDMPGLAEDSGAEDFVIVTLDGNFTFIVTGTDQIPFSEGDGIYVTLTLKESLGMSYWETDSGDDVSSKKTMDYLFYGITGLGIAVAAAGAAKY